MIRESVLFPYFDAAYMSYEQGVQKPDEEIFRRCMNELGTAPEECLYIGDGGSYELETAEKIGMKALQAAWYLKDDPMQSAQRMEHFQPLNAPSEIFDYIVSLYNLKAEKESSDDNQTFGNLYSGSGYGKNA